MKNCISTLNFTFSVQLGSLITLRHVFRWSWNFQKLMQVRYSSDLRPFQVVKVFFPRSGGSQNCQKTHVEHFFSNFDISLIKELLHKPLEIQWNITGTLPRKLKRKFWGALSYKILPPEIAKTWEITICGGTSGAWKPMCNSMVFYDFVNCETFQPLCFG